MTHPRDLSRATRYRLVFACFGLGTVLTAATARVRHDEPITAEIAVGSISGHQPRPKWRSDEVPDGWLASYGVPATVWTVRTRPRGDPDRLPHPVGLATNWLLYTAIACVAAAAVRKTKERLSR